MDVIGSSLQALDAELADRAAQLLLDYTRNLGWMVQDKHFAHRLLVVAMEFFTRVLGSLLEIAPRDERVPLFAEYLARIRVAAASLDKTPTHAPRPTSKEVQPMLFSSVPSYGHQISMAPWADSDSALQLRRSSASLARTPSRASLLRQLPSTTPSMSPSDTPTQSPTDSPRGSLSDPPIEGREKLLSESDWAAAAFGSSKDRWEKGAPPLQPG